MRTLFCFACLALLVVQPVCGGPDEASLKATHQLVVKQVQDGSVTLLKNLIHPKAIGFFLNSQVPVQLRGGGGLEEQIATLAEELAKFSSVTLDSTYQVTGATGIVCARLRLDPEGLKAKKKYDTRFNRVTYVYSWSAERWQLVSWHSSSIPLNK
jgi:hypothetical protein